MPYAYNYIEIAIEGSPQVVYLAPNAPPVPPPPPTVPPTPPPLPGTPMLKDQKVGIIYQQIIDVDGDGLPDFLVMDPSVYWDQHSGRGDIHGRDLTLPLHHHDEDHGSQCRQRFGCL